jgi:O-antigen/teichoic acid export membrane protein
VSAPPRELISQRRDSLLGALCWFAAAYTLSVAGYFATNSLAARLLGATDFGYFLIVTSVTIVIGQLALVGAHRAGLRDAARLQDHDPDRIRRLRRSSRAVAVVNLPVAGAGLGCVAYVLGDGDPVLRLTLAVAVALLVILSGHQKLWAHYLRGFGRIRSASLLEGRSGGAAVSLVQAALLGCGLLFYPDLGLPGVLVAAAVGYLPCVLIGWAMTATCWRGFEAPWRLRADVAYVATSHWRFASAQLASLVNVNTTLWIAGLLLSAEDTSLFGAANRVVLLLAAPMTALQIVFSPMVARLAIPEPATAERLLRTGATAATVLGSMLWIPMMIAPSWLLTTVYGPGFGSAGWVLIILTVGHLVNVVSGLSSTVLAMTDHEGVVATYLWRAVVARVALAVPAAGVAGIWGLALVEASVSAGLAFASWRKTRATTGISTQVTARPNVTLARQTIG